MWANIDLARQTEWESPITTLKLNCFKRNTFPTIVMCITVKLNPWDGIGSYLEWDHLLTMATPIERLNTGKKPLCQICVQRKKPSMSNMATLPLCRFRFPSNSYLSRLLLLLWLTIHSSPMERKSWCQIWIVLSHAVSSSAATPLYVRQNGKWVCCYFALFLIPPNPKWWEHWKGKGGGTFPCQALRWIPALLLASSIALGGMQIDWELP